MKILSTALVAAMTLALPLLAATHASAATCITSDNDRLIYSAAYYECLGHAPKAAEQLAVQHASETGAAS